MTRLLTVLTLSLALAAASPAAAQSPPTTRTGLAGAIEGSAGYAGFVDDSTVGHGLFGGAARFYISPLVSVGPEVVYLRGPEFDRDLFVTGNVTLDLIGNRGRSARVIPFVIAGAGFMRHSNRFGRDTFSSTEGAFTAGGGVRARLSERVFVGGDARCGWELHCRVAGTVGFSFGR